MHIVLGATGHIGSALTSELLDRKEAVTLVTRSAQQPAVQDFVRRGARVAEVTVLDTKALHHILASNAAARLYLLNPPANPMTDDPVVQERRTLRSILAALRDSSVAKIVAQSTYGARPGEREGDLNVLYELEQALSGFRVPVTILRGAYYMSNWDAALDTARSEGRLDTFFPVDFALPMVAPRDIAHRAAKLLTGKDERTGILSIEGPRRYSPRDVAAAFAAALERDVTAVETPRDKWKDAFAAIGFTEAAAASFSAMTATTIDDAASFPDRSTVIQGETTIDDYVANLVSLPKANADAKT